MSNEFWIAVHAICFVILAASNCYSVCSLIRKTNQQWYFYQELANRLFRIELAIDELEERIKKLEKSDGEA